MIKKISFTLLVLVANFMFCATPPPPGGGNGGPAGGAGGVGPGAPSHSPIDMYLYVLIALAIVGLFFYARKYKTQLK